MKSTYEMPSATPFRSLRIADHFSVENFDREAMVRKMISDGSTFLNDR